MIDGQLKFTFILMAGCDGDYINQVERQQKKNSVKV